jgi:ribose transport system substrate-binding protein
MKWLRLIGLLAVGLAAGHLFGCDRASDRIKIAFISNNPFEFWTIARKGTEKAAAEFPDVDVEFRMPAFGTGAEQHRLIEDLVAKGVQGIAISPCDAGNQSRVLNEIIPDRVGFITQDSDLPVSSKRLCYIGTNNIEAGKAVGQLVKEACAKALPDQDQIKIMIYVGALEPQNARERRLGVIAALAGVDDAAAEKLAEGPYPTKPLGGRYVILGTMTDEASKDKCKRNVEDTLNKYGNDVNCLVGLWAYNPPAMLEAVRDARKLGKVQMVGFDEDEDTLEGIRKGHIYATVVQNPYLFGYESVRILRHYARYGELPEPEMNSSVDRVKDDNDPTGRRYLYFVKHRVIKKARPADPRELFDKDVESFHKDLKAQKR